MATVARPQQQADGGVAERRLRPIYEWLDNGNNKKALQEAEKVLRKTPTLQIARALRALALLRLGRSSEALSSLAALAAEKPSEDATLQAMTISYRESQQLRKVCELYEAAVAGNGTSEDLYTQLFMSYVRVGDFRAQQQTAMALYKVAPKNPYYFWAVMSIVLQAKEATDSTKKGVLLSLAQRMVDKLISESRLEAQQEARIYIMILQLQEKYQEILDFMESNVYRDLVPGVMPAASIPYLHQLGRWPELLTLCKKLLWDNPDRWDYYVPFLDASFQLMSDDGEDTPEKCYEFICQLIEHTTPASNGGKSRRVIRGPYLARLELYKRLQDSGRNAQKLLGDAIDLCTEYVYMFAHKPCCVSDVKPYLATIPLADRHTRMFRSLARLRVPVRGDTAELDWDAIHKMDTLGEKLETIQQHVNLVGVWRLCAAPDPQAEASLADAMRTHYLRAVADGLAPATPTEFPTADTYAVLAARNYYLAALAQQSSRPILEALHLLETVLKNSPSNHHAKLLALKLYHVLGNGGAADTIYTLLEVKHIQLSSLGWLHATRLQPAGLPARALALHTITHRFHTHHTRDSADHLTYSYKYGTFEKLVELMEFSVRVERCAWCAAAGLERALLELVTGAGGTFSPPSDHHPHLADNRDLAVMTAHDPPHRIDPELQSTTFRHELAFLALRSAIVNAVALSIEVVGAVNNSHTNSNKPLDRDQLLADLAVWLHKLDDTCRRFKETYRSTEISDLVSAPFPSRIIALVNSPVPYRELYGAVLSLGVPLARADAGAAHAACERATALLRRADAALRECVERRRRGDALWATRDTVEELYNYVELISLVTFELGVCGELATPHSRRSKKKNAGTETAEEQRTNELLADLNHATQASIALVEQLLESWPEPAAPADLVERLNALKLGDDPVTSKLQAGHVAMLADMRSVLAKKTKALKALL